MLFIYFICCYVKVKQAFLSFVMIDCWTYFNKMNSIMWLMAQVKWILEKMCFIWAPQVKVRTWQLGPWTMGKGAVGLLILSSWITPGATLHVTKMMTCLWQDVVLYVLAEIKSKTVWNVFYPIWNAFPLLFGNVQCRTAPSLQSHPWPAVSRTLSFPSPPSALARDTLPALHSPRPDCLPACSSWQSNSQGRMRTTGQLR